MSKQRQEKKPEREPIPMPDDRGLPEREPIPVPPDKERPAPIDDPPAPGEPAPIDEGPKGPKQIVWLKNHKDTKDTKIRIENLYLLCVFVVFKPFHQKILCYNLEQIEREGP